MRRRAPQGVPTTVTDDNGVQHQACVDSAADPVAPAPAAVARQGNAVAARSNLWSVTQLPRTGAGTGGLVIAALVGRQWFDRLAGEPPQARPTRPNQSGAMAPADRQRVSAATRQPVAFRP